MMEQQPDPAAALRADGFRGAPGLQSACTRAAAAASRIGRRLAAALLAAVFAAGPCSGFAAAHAAAPAAPAAHPYAPHVAEASRRFGIPADWIWRVMDAESRGRPDARSRAGAMGVMQVMPATWAMLSARHGLGSDPYDVRANILAGAAYLRAMWDRYGDVTLMLVAYNAGPGRADAYAAGRRGLPAETVAYLAKLAPALGAPDRAARVPNAPPQSAWRDAPLFTARSPSEDGESTGDTVPAAGSLFVPLSGRNR